MPVVKIEPTDEYPVPFSTDDEELDTFADKLASIGNTADLLESLGAIPEATRGTLAEEKKLLDKALKEQTITPLKTSLPAALGASAFLKAYGKSRAFDTDEIRAALTNKLLEIADCGEVKYELRAIELLGKHSDVGLFSERSEVTITHQTTDELKEKLRAKLQRLIRRTSGEGSNHSPAIEMDGEIIDVDAELGLSVEKPLDTPSESENKPEICAKTAKTGEYYEPEPAVDADGPDDSDNEAQK